MRLVPAIITAISTAISTITVVNLAINVCGIANPMCLATRLLLSETTVF